MEIAHDASPPPTDEIERALKTFANLPDMVDLRLEPAGIHLRTDDFPRLIIESCGLDLRQYFVDALKDADFLPQSERDRLSDELFRVFSSVNAFSTDQQGATMHRTEKSFISLPHEMSQGFVQQMTIERQVKFRLAADLPDKAVFENVHGITFNVVGKILALSELHLKAENGNCIIRPVFDERGMIPHSGGKLDRIKNAGKDLLVALLVRARRISTKLPIVMQEFREYLHNAVNFKALLQEPGKDLVMFFERTANIVIEDPLTRSLLLNGNRILKEGEAIEVERQSETVCELGGVCLKMAPKIKLTVARTIEQLNIEKIAGVNIEVPFESPSELKAIGLDLERSLPKSITSLKLGARTAVQTRRLVAGTAPGCWLGLDLAKNLQPAVDENGNWLIFGVTHNPISGAPQRFHLRLDQQNNLNMSPREIAAVVTKTAIEGFDPNNPLSWSWAAVAIGGQTFLAAEELMRSAKERNTLQEKARKLGRLIGRLIDDL
jgi:hypothetical protein